MRRAVMDCFIGAPFEVRKFATYPPGIHAAGSPTSFGKSFQFDAIA